MYKYGGWGCVSSSSSIVHMKMWATTGAHRISLKTPPARRQEILRKACTAALFAWLAFCPRPTYKLSFSESYCSSLDGLEDQPTSRQELAVASRCSDRPALCTSSVLDAVIAINGGLRATRPRSRVSKTGGHPGNRIRQRRTTVEPHRSLVEGEVALAVHNDVALVEETASSTPEHSLLRGVGHNHCCCRSKWRVINRVGGILLGNALHNNKPKRQGIV